MVKMVDITDKLNEYREATAVGEICLKEDTLKKILEGKVEKGDVFSIAQVAAIMAAKKTSEIIPLCHHIPITGADVSFRTTERGLEVKATIRSTSKTGVEMEALTAVSVALLTIWDMVKKLEKDERGQYPSTKITYIYVESKLKRAKP